MRATTTVAALQPPGETPAARIQLGRLLLAWYDRQQRDLPWRRTRDPYRIWLSEVMLQQTQVATVIGYYERFLAELPTLEALARADEQQVLRLWEGLGYYRRARQLHQAAQIVMREHQGRVPQDVAALRRLPGIGRYTAGAIASIAHGVKAPILEANTIRLVCRLIGYRGDPTTSAGQRLLWDTVESWLPEHHVGQFNQALMELGSQVCTVRGPRCAECPLRAICRSRAEGSQQEIPQPKRPPRWEEVHEAALVVRRGQRVLLRRCQAGERWAGLWDFPRFAWQPSTHGDTAAQLADELKRRFGVTARVGQCLATLRHGVTRFRITLVCHEARWYSGPGRALADAWAWAQVAELAEYPLSATGRRLANLLARAVPPVRRRSGRIGAP